VLDRGYGDFLERRKAEFRAVLCRTGTGQTAHRVRRLPAAPAFCFAYALHGCSEGKVGRR